MDSEGAITPVPRRVPGRLRRVVSVWFRHYKVYSSAFLANATPAVLEPVFFLLAIGLGLGRYIDAEFNGLPFASFMAPGLLGMTSAYTAAFEASYGTFVRYRWQQTYDCMRATPLTVADIFIGELLWCASKGFLFATIVGIVLLAFGHVKSPFGVLIPVVGFFAAMTFAGLSFIVTSMVKSMNQFQFYFTLVLTPLIFFSGLMFPVQDLPGKLSYVAYCLPMFHIIETFRLIVSGPAHASVSWSWICPFVLVAMAISLGTVGVRRMMGKLLGG